MADSDEKKRGRGNPHLGTMNRTPETRKKRRQQAQRQWATRKAGNPDGGAQIGKPSPEPPNNAAEIIETASEEGCTVLNICAALGIGRETFTRWRDQYPHIEAAFRAGRGREHDRLVNKLTEMALRGNVTAIIFSLKSRHNYIDSGVGAVVENKVAITFQLPGSLSPEEYLKTLTAQTEVIRPEQAEKALAQPGVKRAVIRQLVRGEAERKTDGDIT